MRIAAFYSDSPFASWGQSRGFGAVLKRMGHDVTEIPVPQGYRSMRQIKRADLSRINKPIDDCELVIVSGPEHLRDWILQFYPEWQKLKMPKVGWYHESFHAREDYQLNINHFTNWLDYHVFPDKDDAEKYNGLWLSLGVDVEMFRPRHCMGCERAPAYWEHTCQRDIDCAFIGLMYPKRVRFYQELQPFLEDINLRVGNGNIIVQDFDGVNVLKSTELLAETYRRIKVFVAFPSLSNVLVAKLLESMASGCYLIAPEQREDLQSFVSFKTPSDCAEHIRLALKFPRMLEELSRKGCAEVHEKHRMELRFEKIFQMIGVTACQESLSAAGPASLVTTS